MGVVISPRMRILILVAALLVPVPTLSQPDYPLMLTELERVHPRIHDITRRDFGKILSDLIQYCDDIDDGGVASTHVARVGLQIEPAGIDDEIYAQLGAEWWTTIRIAGRSVTWIARDYNALLRQSPACIPLFNEYL